MSKNQQKSTNSLETGLTPVQERTAILLASGESISSVAEKLQLNRSTIYQWQDMLTFQCFFNQQKQDIREGLRSEIFSLGEMAVKVLKDCLQSENESLKLKASLAILDKIESAEIGAYSARNVLKEQATRSALSEDWDTPFLHQEEYEELLEENGLK